MTNLEQKRKAAVYKACKNLMYTHGLRFNKKHGNYLVRYCPNNQVVIMDTWNGAISQGHCTVNLVNGQYGPEGKIEYHTHISDGWNRDEYRFELDEGVDLYKTLLASN